MGACLKFDAFSYWGFFLFSIFFFFLLILNLHNKWVKEIRVFGYFVRMGFFKINYLFSGC